MVLALVALPCAAQLDNYKYGNPNDSANYGYLNSYGNLKDYINYDKYPNFKLGVGTTATEYLKKGIVYNLTNSNFTETEPGNAMKYGSCVKNDGSMDFTTVKSYVNAATSAGLSVYGHTLGWHEQQNITWLNSLLQDHPAVALQGDTTVYTDFYTKDYTKNQSIGWHSDFTEYKYSVSFSSTDGLHVNTIEEMNYWLVQYLALDGIPTKAGSSYTMFITIKASGSGIIHSRLGNWDGGAQADFPFTTEWKEVTVDYDCSTDGSFLLFQHGDFVGDIYIKSIRITEPVSAIKTPDGVKLPTPTPLTAQEKHDTLVWAMEKWIKGIMEACDGKVKAWDVVNEAISGGNKDSEGFYALQHASASTTNFFYWQDYMGDLEYVRQAVRLARKYGPEDIQLFINDYNLESDWDSNLKLQSLIKWIERWEADGVTHIDGIGTQMHISYYMDYKTQQSKKTAILNMLKLMAKSGKKVRISELDMGFVDSKGNSVSTDKMTESMHKSMSSYYQWIVQKYLEIIPVDQQWGICQWCATDSQKSGGWRPDTPVGLWTRDYYRKHTYAGFAKGLGGVNYTPVESVQPSGYANSYIYDLSGRRMNSQSVLDLPAGFYIMNGKVIRKQ